MSLGISPSLSCFGGGDRDLGIPSAFTAQGGLWDGIAKDPLDPPEKRLMRLPLWLPPRSCI